MGGGSFQIDRDLGGLGVSYGQLLSAANSALYQPMDCFNPEVVDTPRFVNGGTNSREGSGSVLADGIGTISRISGTSSGKLNQASITKSVCALLFLFLAFFY
jgi:hypothetical protein